MSQYLHDTAVHPELVDRCAFRSKRTLLQGGTLLSALRSTRLDQTLAYSLASIANHNAHKQQGVARAPLLSMSPPLLSQYLRVIISSHAAQHHRV